MGLKSRFRVENVGVLATFSFYAIVGILCFVFFAMANFPPHVGIIGILNLVAAYGLLRKRSWAIWVVVMLFFIATTFSAYMLYYLFGLDLFLDISMIAYLVLTWAFTAYVAAKRKILEA